jgi:integrase
LYVAGAFKDRDAGRKLLDVAVVLNHTAATLLLAMGVDPRTIMETLGHSQISLTMNTYTHVVKALQVEAAAKMNAILGGE